MDQVPVIMMDSIQPSIGPGALSELHHTVNTGLDHAPHTAQPVTQDPLAPPLRTTCCLGDLIIGPEASNWSHLLLTSNHLDTPTHYYRSRDDARLALSRTCRAARDMIMATAPKARLTLHVYDEGMGAARLQALKQALLTRHNLPTKMHLEAASCNALCTALGSLNESTTWVDDLRLECYEHLSTSFFPAIGRFCPNLRVLDIQTPLAHLPPVHTATPPLQNQSGSLPKLEELHVRVDTEGQELRGILTDIAPYVKQLKVLKVVSIEGHGSLDVCMPPELVPLLFNPAGTIASHLHTLHIAADLDDALLDLLLAGAPALEDLTVCDIELESDVHVHTECRWRALEAWTTSLHLSTLARLPTAPGLSLSLEGYVEMTLVCDVTGSEQEVAAARIDDVYYALDERTHLSVAAGKDLEDETHALHTFLARQLRKWYTHPFIELQGWTVTADLLRVLRDHLPADQCGVWFGREMIWPLENPTEMYLTLLRTLPKRFNTVMFSTKGMTSEQVISVCLSAPIDRTRDSPLDIELVSLDPGPAQIIRQGMAQMGLYPNVVIKHRSADEFI